MVPMHMSTRATCELLIRHVPVKMERWRCQTLVELLDSVDVEKEWQWSTRQCMMLRLTKAFWLRRNTRVIRGNKWWSSGGNASSSKGGSIGGGELRSSIWCRRLLRYVLSVTCFHSEKMEKCGFNKGGFQTSPHVILRFRISSQHVDPCTEFSISVRNSRPKMVALHRAFSLCLHNCLHSWNKKLALLTVPNIPPPLPNISSQIRYYSLSLSLLISSQR